MYAAVSGGRVECGNTGFEIGGWLNKEVREIEGDRVLLMRIPGLGGKVVARLLTTVVLLSAGEIVPALKFGQIDASERADLTMIQGRLELECLWK